MFVYCLNNPINYTDITGNWPQWLDDLLEEIINFFSPDTGVTTTSYEDADSSGEIKLTAGYSEFSLNFLGQENAIDRKRDLYQKSGFIGISGDASIVNFSANIGSKQNEDMSLSLNGSADFLSASGYAGYQYKNGLGIGAGAYAAVLSGTVTGNFEFYGWQIIIGVTGDVGAIGAEGAIGFIDGVGRCEIKAAAGFGGGFIVEIKPPIS